MRDFEQLYYDLLYEFKKIKKEKEYLEQEVEIYKNLPHNKGIRNIIIESLSKYLQRK